MFRILLGIVFLATITGCATTGAKNSQEQLQMRITDLEKKVEEKDSEIVDLQYQVKDISSKVTSGSPEDSASTESTSTIKGSSKIFTDEIIRVDASIKDIQTALKNAGSYSGKIDGKVGSGTKAAIMDFQKNNNLSADGVLGRRTWKALKSYLKE
jgi:peptidoglycan hydrolase-like protein with peptidoglycan-binding domain